MPRAPRIAPLPEHEWDDDTRALIQKNWFSDRPTKGQSFFKTMVRHRELFRVWNEFGRTAFNGRLPDRDRELLILRTAWLTRCRFEWAYHEPLCLRLGMTAEEIQRITLGPDASGWSELDAADDLELIEIPVVVGQYHLVAFFNNAVGVEVDPQLPGLPGSR
jgi:AhpD family alkylhydroperoxidase